MQKTLLVVSLVMVIFTACQGKTDSRTKLKAAIAQVENKEALSTTHVVSTKGLRFSPEIILVAPGDTISWVNMRTHNSVSVKGMIPEDASPWRSQLSKDFQVTLTTKGVYAYVCTPHLRARMGGFIIVGDPVNLDAVIAAAEANAPYRFLLDILPQPSEPSE